jgi:hypothetical protein
MMGRVQNAGSEMVTSPSIKIMTVGEPITDAFGQRWSPATIAIEWPATSGPTAQLEPPAVHVQVVASYRPDMGVDQLRQAHFSAALDVLSSALLALERPGEPAQDMSMSTVAGSHVARIRREP